eukprot:g54774.t1
MPNIAPFSSPHRALPRLIVNRFHQSRQPCLPESQTANLRREKLVSRIKTEIQAPVNERRRAKMVWTSLTAAVRPNYSLATQDTHMQISFCYPGISILTSRKSFSPPNSLRTLQSRRPSFPRPWTR